MTEYIIPDATFDDVLRQFVIMRAAIMHGVYFDGSMESIGGITKEEALDTASDFITTFEEWQQTEAQVKRVEDD